MNTLNINDIVETEHGIGVIVEIETYNSFNRYGLELNNNPFPYSPVFYLKREISKEGRLKQ